MKNIMIFAKKVLIILNIKLYLTKTTIRIKYNYIVT